MVKGKVRWIQKTVFMLSIKSLICSLGESRLGRLGDLVDVKIDVTFLNGNTQLHVSTIYKYILRDQEFDLSFIFYMVNITFIFEKQVNF